MYLILSYGLVSLVTTLTLECHYSFLLVNFIINTLPSLFNGNYKTNHRLCICNEDVFLYVTFLLFICICIVICQQLMYD